MPLVIKKDRSRQAFDEAKLRRGLANALQKRPVSAEEVDQLVSRVTQQLCARGEKEVSSQVIGELVMLELKKLDQVAYVRFASVYRSFQAVDDFDLILKHLQQDKHE